MRFVAFCFWISLSLLVGLYVGSSITTNHYNEFIVQYCPGIADPITRWEHRGIVYAPAALLDCDQIDEILRTGTTSLNLTKKN